MGNVLPPLFTTAGSQGTIHTPTIKHLTKLKIAQYKTHKLMKTFPHIVAEHLTHIILDKHKLEKEEKKHYQHY
jgi:hypothetical protein